jgi:superfamily II DNA or RNA helicase
MSTVELTAELLARIAGWEAVKQARGLIAAGRVREAAWAPPRLTGLVQDAGATLRAGLVIHDAVNVDNLCSCRQARRDGTICAHAVAVGLQVIAERQKPLPAAAAATTAPPPATAGKRLQRAGTVDDAEPLELHVILPPNFAAALAKGKVMVVIEAVWRRARTPLNALPLTTPFALPPEDAALLDVLEALASEPPGMVLLPAADFGRLLPRLVGHPRVTLGRNPPLTVAAAPLRLKIQATLETNGEITLRLSGPAPAVLVTGDTAWALRGNTLAPISLPPACHELLRGPVRLTRPQVPAFLNQDWPALGAGADVAANFQIEDFSLQPLTPRFQLALKGGLAQLDATLRCAYGDRLGTPGKLAPDEPPWLPDAASPTRYAARDFAAEQAAVARLLRAGFSAPDAAGHCRLDGENAVLNFFAREFPRLQREWTVTLEERLERSTATKLERIEPAFRVTPAGEQWFDLQLGFASAGGERFSAADIQRLILSGQSHTRLRNGRIALLDTGAVEELQQVLLDCEPAQQAGVHRIAAAQAGFLDATLRAQPGWQVQAPAAWQERVRQQGGDARLDCPPLGDLANVLRPYQQHGVAWLAFLRRNGFGGILADEMGLGKTAQVLALLQSQSAAPSLVVCPTSLVHNWVAEAAKFTPKLRVLTLHGPDRHARFAGIPQHDLVVTSYALIRRDAEQYRDLEFDTVILDEAQHIKNRATQNAQAVKAVRSRHRLVLTGTPLENSVLDLWSIFDFLMPGYLGAAKDFHERYEVPIARDRDEAAQARLARRVRPFLLRRLKREVAADLPAKLEQISLCDLTAEQAAVYRQLLDAGRREVLDAVGAQGLAKSRMVVLTTLLRLRQACCDLRLLNLPGVPPEGASGKLELFGELLEEILDGGHRALVFSQFTTMLALLRERLAGDGVAFCYLDGATTDRAGVVRHFQTRADVPVFLISLKAGGTGLNLTAADTVVHFDPWWNPAVEAQATDRAHRIGQTRVVTSYKLISRGTVEEKILRLQERKRATLAALLGEESLAEALDWNEIQELLAG